MRFFEYKAIKVWLADKYIFVELEDGRLASLPVEKFPFLHEATVEERQQFKIVEGYALYWPALGEELSVAVFFEEAKVVSKRLQTSGMSKQ